MIKKSLENILNKKKQAKTFRQKVSKFNKPIIFIVFGFIFAFLSGLVAPMFGLFIMKDLSAIMYSDACNKLKENANQVAAGYPSALAGDPFRGSDYECDTGLYVDG